VVGFEGMSREELLAVVVSQAEQIQALTVLVAELRAELGKNSQNSSLPPSSDRFTRAPRRAGTGRRPGKQPGAPGRTLEAAADLDQVVDHVPDRCGRCGAGLVGAVQVGVQVRQVHDVPSVRVRVVEHRMHRLRCRCGQVSVASAPAQADGPVCYGPRLRVLAVYLVVFQHVPAERAAVLIADVTGARVSTGWVAAQAGRFARNLDGFADLVVQQLRACPVVGVDETTVGVGGARQWLHVARTDALTAYHLDPSRGREAAKAGGVLEGYDGTLVHDALKVYDAWPAGATHALCGAHLLRELTAVAQAHPEALWPDQARRALVDLSRAARAARAAGLAAIPPQTAAEPLHLLRHAVLVGLAAHPRAPGRKQTKARNLLERLRDRSADILRFTTDLAVPFTNNGSERDLRPVKTQMKISGCHRSAETAKAWLRVRGYISTARKHSQDVMTVLHDAITGNPWLPPTPATT